MNVTPQSSLVLSPWGQHHGRRNGLEGSDGGLASRGRKDTVSMRRDGVSRIRAEDSKDNHFCLSPAPRPQTTGAGLEKAPQVSWTQLASVRTQVLTLAFPLPSLYHTVLLRFRRGSILGAAVESLGTVVFER